MIAMQRGPGRLARAIAAVACLVLWAPLDSASAGGHGPHGAGQHKGAHGRPGKPKPPAPDPVLLEAFDELLDEIRAIPRRELNHGLKKSFAAKVEAARRRYEKGRVCPSANVLRAYLHHAQAMRRARRLSGVAEKLYAAGRALRDQVVAQAVPPNPCFDPAIGRAPEVEVLASDNRVFRARVRFGAASFSPAEAGGETWTQVSLPGIENVVGPAGQPSLPSWQALIGVPTGAEVRLPAVQTTIRERLAANLYPFQPQAADQSNPRFGEEPLPPPETFMDPPFQKDAKAYETNAFAPPNPCAVRLLGRARDLTIAQVQCNAARYNPVSDALELLEAVDFELRFEGGQETFITRQTLSPFEPASSELASAVLNQAAVLRFVEAFDFGILRCIGEELLILTHPSFRPAADTLATWKRTKGIMTSVVEVGGGTDFATGAQIDDLIEDRYDTCIVRASYVLLLGDSEFVPPARSDHDTTTACPGCGDPTTGSDLAYATYPQFFLDIFPDFGVGRIPVDTPAEAELVVNKIVQYESSPPFLGFGGGGPFYNTATHASYFQCCRTGSPAGRDMRTFVQTSELARNVLAGAGYTVERIYNTNTDYQSQFVADPTPRRYFDGSGLPAALAPGSGFAWDGDTADITAAFNAGRFLIFHRDHGGSTGWGDPPFSTGNFGALANGALLPVVYGVNCSSGFWDRETDRNEPLESFMEQLLLRSGGGMVGGLGDNRDSPTWANSALSRGFFDATWTNVAPEFGGAASKRRLGDVLNHGKLYLLTQIGVAQPGGEVLLDEVLGEWILWHAFGDPTLEMWTRNPYRLLLPIEFRLERFDDLLRVHYAAEGATLTAWQPGFSRQQIEQLPIGRARVEKGVAELSFFTTPDPQLPILLSASQDDAVSVLLTRAAGPGPIN